jgi:dihydrofolate reductase
MSSSTLDSAEWSNTTVIRGDVAAEVADLKRQSGRDLIVCGHGQFGQTVMDANLVDDLTLTVVPVFVGEGAPMFRTGESARPWELVSAGPRSDPGLASLTYRPV